MKKTVDYTALLTLAIEKGILIVNKERRQLLWQRSGALLVMLNDPDKAVQECNEWLCSVDYGKKIASTIMSCIYMEHSAS